MQCDYIEDTNMSKAQTSYIFSFEGELGSHVVRHNRIICFESGYNLRWDVI